MSLALAALIAQTLRHRLQMLYPLQFFMPGAMWVGFAGLYRLSGDPLFLTVLAVFAETMSRRQQLRGSRVLRFSERSSSPCQVTAVAVSRD